MNRFVSALSVLTSLLGACTTAPTPVPPSAADPSTSADSPVASPAPSDDTASQAAEPTSVPLSKSCSGPSDETTVQNLAQDGQTLRVTVSYGGGCGDHTFQACWNGAVAKSMPPQATIELRHDGHGDTCEAWVTEELAIDVSSLLERTAGTVVVRLGDERIRLETP